MDFKKCKCFTCEDRIAALEHAFSHPLLEIIICTKCFDYYNEPNWTLDENGRSDYCNACAEGGDILPCDAKICTKAFCFECLEKVYSKERYNEIKQMCEDDEDEQEWLCPICRPPEKIEKLKRRCLEMVKLRKKKGKVQKVVNGYDTSENEVSDGGDNRPEKRSGSPTANANKRLKLSTSTSNIPDETVNQNGHDDQEAAEKALENADREMLNCDKLIEAANKIPQNNNQNTSNSSLQPPLPEPNNTESPPVSTANQNNSDDDAAASIYSISTTSSPDPTFIDDLSTLPPRYQEWINRQVRRNHKNKRLKTEMSESRILKQEQASEQESVLKRSTSEQDKTLKTATPRRNLIITPHKKPNTKSSPASKSTPKNVPTLFNSDTGSSSDTPPPAPPPAADYEAEESEVSAKKDEDAKSQSSQKTKKKQSRKQRDRQNSRKSRSTIDEDETNSDSDQEDIKDSDSSVASSMSDNDSLADELRRSSTSESDKDDQKSSSDQSFTGKPSRTSTQKPKVVESSSDQDQMVISEDEDEPPKKPSPTPATRTSRRLRAKSQEEETKKAIDKSKRDTSDFTTDSSDDEVAKKLNKQMKDAEIFDKDTDDENESSKSKKDSENSKNDSENKKSTSKPKKKPIAFSSDSADELINAEKAKRKSDRKSKLKDDEKDSESSGKQSKKSKKIILLSSDDEEVKNSTDKPQSSKSKKKNPIAIDSDDDLPPTPPGSSQENDKDIHPFFNTAKKKKAIKTTLSGDESDTLNTTQEEKGTPQKKKRGINLPQMKKGRGSKFGRNKQLRKKRKKRVRKILTKDALTETTKNAIQEEEDRRSRLQKLMQEGLNKSDDEEDAVYMDCQHKIPIDPGFVKVLKPHQVEGVRHIFDNLYESGPTVEKEIEYYDEQDEAETDEALQRYGKGCLIAHCMGLGKTLTTIAFLHTVMNHDVLSNELVGRTALVMCPKNVYQNWYDEVMKWSSKCHKSTRYPVYMFPEGGRDKDKKKVEEMKRWRKRGGLMIITYDQFKNHIIACHTEELEPQLQDGTKYKKKTKKKAAGKKKIYKGLREDFKTCLLDPGPDIVVLDEAHIIKNQESHIHTTVSLMQSQRRIALTGTPMQNNLEEYYWMVNFCKPQLLGNIKEYKNQYSDTIKKGQTLDATDHDIRMMHEYSSLLYTILKDTVHRRDEGTLKKMLPAKNEFLIQMRLTGLQERLYERYMESRGFGLDFITKSDRQMKKMDSDMIHAMKSNMKAGLFADKLKLETLCFHPGLFQQAVKEDVDEQEADEDSEMDDFIDDDDEDSYETSENSDNPSSSRKNTDNENGTKKYRDNPSSFIFNKDFKELKEYCLEKFKTHKKNDKDYDLQKLQSLFDAHISEDGDIGQIRRMAYGLFFTEKKEIEKPWQFIPALLPSYFMSESELRELREEKTIEMKQLMEQHFRKKGFTTASEIREEMLRPEYQQHSKNQIENQIETKKFDRQHAKMNSLDKDARNKIEAVIKEDAGLKAKKDALQWFNDEENPYEYDYENIDVTVGCKLNFCMKMLEICQDRGEKLVIASQRMDVLNQFEFALEQLARRNIKEKKKEKKRKVVGYESEDEEGKLKKRVLTTTKKFIKWEKEADFFRIDGSVGVEKRMRGIAKFNDKSNKRVRLMLLSTKAGGIGINLTGANRMILTDVSFNPANDRQALFRIYRLGQKHDCMIYRLVADGTMEHAIFKRQIDKMHLSHRVVDEKNCERMYKESDLKELYRYKPHLTYTPSTLMEKAKGDSLETSQMELLPPENDTCLQQIFTDDNLVSKIANWKPVDSLMVEDTKTDQLTDEEKAEIWKKHKAKLLAGERSTGGYLSYGQQPQESYTQGFQQAHLRYPNVYQQAGNFTQQASTSMYNPSTNVLNQLGITLNGWQRLPENQKTQFLAILSQNGMLQ